MARGALSQYPHSRAASCRSGRVPLLVSAYLVSIPSQSGSLLSVRQPISGSGRGHVSIPSQSGSLLSARSLWDLSVASICLNTLTVGQPLVGTGPGRPAQPPKTCLNTLTVGQPLVGWSTLKLLRRGTTVSIPSQSGSLLSDGAGGDEGHAGAKSQYPHSRAASCRGLPVR